MSAKDNWTQKDEGMLCMTCMWYVQKGLTILGRCRKNAPTLSGFPAVFATDWCGQHKIDTQMAPLLPHEPA